MGNNDNLIYAFKRFWIVEEGRFVNPESIQIQLRYIQEGSKSWRIGGKDPRAIWVMPTFMKDVNNKMIYAHDIVEYIGERYRIEFVDGEWLLYDADGKTHDELPAAYDECEIVGNMFESASKLMEVI